MLVPTTLETLNSHKGLVTEALLDCKATGCYINKAFAMDKGLELNELAQPIPVYNADGTPNHAGRISHTAKLRITIQDHTEVTTFAVTNTGKSDVIIGYNWLWHHNPTVDWKKGTLQFN